ncbi:MAG: extracellular solute-binding protein [Gammaproteobacteria bacterium]|nr:extracellular solute-binding protein [Gammaproteobacteria bacterium]
MKIRFLLTSIFLLTASLTYAQDELTVVNFGGSFAKAAEEGFEVDFVAETGIKINKEDYNGGLAQIRAQVEAGSVFWDAVYTETKDVVIGCDEGLFEYLDELELPPAPDGTPAEEDFYPGSNHECGISHLFWATAVAFDTRQFEDKTTPTQLEHFFDPETYPGRRGVHRNPVSTLEFALMADGVHPDKVYEVLGTDEGLMQALSMYDKIKDQIVWWEAGAHPPQLLADGEVSMTTAWNGRIFNAQVLENQPIEIIWDGHTVDIGYLVVVAGAPNLEHALEFVRYSAKTEAILGIASRIAYSPTRKSATAMLSTHIPTGVEMLPHMPYVTERPGRKLVHDAEFWADHLDDINERFSAWLSN